MGSDTPNMNTDIPIIDAIFQSDKSPPKSNISSPVDDRSKPREDDTDKALIKNSDHPAVPITEMLIFLGPDHLTASPIESSKTSRTEIQLSEISNYPAVETFVFEDPNAFRELFETIPNTETQSELSATRNAVTKVRLVLPNSHRDQSLKLDPTYEAEKSEKVDITELYSEWRAACRALPMGHGITEVIFDVTQPERFNPFYIAPLFHHPIVQHISTVLAFKAKGPFCCRLDGLAEDMTKQSCVQGCFTTMESQTER